jgi:hypothetical protein
VFLPQPDFTSQSYDVIGDQMAIRCRNGRVPSFDINCIIPNSVFKYSK